MDARCSMAGVGRIMPPTPGTPMEILPPSDTADTRCTAEGRGLATPTPAGAPMRSPLSRKSVEKKPRVRMPSSFMTHIIIHCGRGSRVAIVCEMLCVDQVDKLRTPDQQSGQDIKQGLASGLINNGLASNAQAGVANASSTTCQLHANTATLSNAGLLLGGHLKGVKSHVPDDGPDPSHLHPKRWYCCTERADIVVFILCCLSEI